MCPTTRTKARCALVALLLLSATPALQAGSISVDSGWQLFNWVGLPPAYNTGGPLTFSSTSAVKLSVTDTFIDGDRFLVLDNNKPIGTTSIPSNDGDTIGDPNAAFKSIKWSHGTFMLGAGSHSLQFVTIDEALGYPGGGAFFRLDSQGTISGKAPEPGSFTLLAIGLAGLMWRRRGKLPVGA